MEGERRTSPEAAVRSEFERLLGDRPRYLVRAPGRVNLIGEHTDYNDGFVLPMAIDRAVCIALRPRSDDRVRVFSLDFDEWGEFELGRLERGRGWLEYVKGMAWALAGEGHELRGWEGVVAGDVPRGSGLSSSAALEMATARAFLAVSNLQWSAKVVALLGQKVENDWLGVNSGIMDQLISAAGREGHALLIDCRTLEADPVPLPAGVAVVVMDTMTRRGLVDSKYNERREQCERAAAHFGVSALRDVTPADFQVGADGLEDTVRRRARHVVTENLRTLRAADALRRGDAVLLGRLMDESHASLRDDFEVSSPALDGIVACARWQDACYGARMTGAGFGGCAVALVAAERVEAFTDAVGACYERATGKRPSLHVCRASEGAQILPATEPEEPGPA